MTTEPKDPAPKDDNSASAELTPHGEPAKPEEHTSRGRSKRDLSRSLLSVDAWVDTSLWHIWSRTVRTAESYDSFLRRFRVRGIRRMFAELLSDACTYGLFGLVLMVALALPSMRATENSDWRTTDDFAVTFLDRYGQEIGQRGIILNDTVPLDQLPDTLIKATLATEDRRFFEHYGVDVIGTFRALMENVRAHGVVQGGSTLTQQLAKNLFLSNERSLQRKIKEAFLAVWLETHLTKRQILKLYLDRAYMGGGVFGVAAAAEFYFGKNVRDLTLAESAMLAGLYKAPTKYAPHVNLPAARARANQVLTNMVEAGFLTEGQVIGARRHPAVAVDRSDEDVPNYFLDWAFDQVKELAKHDPVLAHDRIITVRTTFDPALQHEADAAVQTTLRDYSQTRHVSEAALVSMVPDGAVRAMVGGSDYGASQFNRAVNAMRQPGSSFKPFVYVTAFMNGYSPDSIVPDAPISIGNWSPHNYERRYAGPVTLTTALTHSYNTVPVRLAQAIGRPKIIQTAYQMGITHPLKNTISLPLGSEVVCPIDMVSSYSAFANGGFRAKPYAIREITDSTGKVIYNHNREEQPPVAVLPPDKVEEMNQVLVNVVQHGTGRRARLNGIVVAGKTGTTNNYRDAWFVGYTSRLATAVWVGNDDYSPMARVTGGTLPALTWFNYMDPALKGRNVPTLPGVDPSILPDVPVASRNSTPEPIVVPRTLNRQSTKALKDIADALTILRQQAGLGASHQDQTAVRQASAEVE